MASLTNKLSGPKLRAMLDELYQLSAEPTLKQIADVMVRYGITSPTANDGRPSEMAARTLRDGPFARHLARLQRGKQLTDAIMGAVREGHSALDASEELAAQELLDVLTDVDEDERPDVSKLSGTILNLRMAASARRGDERKDKETEKKLELADQRIAALEREKLDWEKKRNDAMAAVAVAAKKGGITPETRKMIEAAMKGEAAA